MPAQPRRWGWHQLDDRAARRLVRAAGVQPGDLVLDVGAGTGAITRALLEAGARVLAVELHPGRAARLRRRFAGSDVRVIRADAADLRLPRRPFRVVANPPFAASVGLLRRLVSPRSRLRSADLVLPRSLARRWCDQRAPGAGRWASTFDVSIVANVSHRALRPPPPHPVVVLRVRRLASGAVELNAR